MKSNQRSPILPYLCVLGCLFVLCLVSPGSWTSLSRSHLNLPDVSLSDVLSGDNARPAASASLAAPPINKSDLTEFRPTPIAVSVAPQIEPRIAKVAERIAKVRRYSPEMNLAANLEAPAEPAVQPRTPIAVPAAEIAHTLAPAAIQQIPVAAWWPEPRSLLRRLDILRAHTATRVWASEVVKRIQLLSKVASPEDPSIPDILSELDALNGRAAYLVSDRNEGELAAELRRVRHALSRRLDLWQRVAAAERAIVAREQEHAAQLARGTSDRPAATMIGHARSASSHQYDARELLVAQERYEASWAPSDGRRLAAELQRLGAVEHPGVTGMQDQLESHYRNANVRLAVHGDFLNQLLPQPELETSPVRDTIVGVPVRGQSNTTTKLQLRLLPNENQIRLGLEAFGSVDSMTKSDAGPVRFYNHGDGEFAIRKLIIVDPSGVRVKPAQAEAQSATSVADLRTDFDAIPLVRDIVRSYAISEHRAKQGQAKREVEFKMASTALQRFDRQADTQIATAESKLRDRLFTPMADMQLEISPVELRTTDERVYLRLRVAGDEQLGAHTARPRAPSNSVMSLQIHQTAINNFIQQLDLDGRTFTIPELHRWVGDQLQAQLAPLDEDVPDDVEITFAEENAIMITCDQGLLELHLSIDRLKQGRRSWREFGIRATYRPAPQGINLLWEREGVVELTGQRYAGRPEIVLRGIFAKVLHKDRPLNLTPEGARSNPRLAAVTVTQCVAEDGWIGIALGSDAVPPAGLSLEARRSGPAIR